MTIPMRASREWPAECLLIRVEGRHFIVLFRLSCAYLMVSKLKLTECLLAGQTVKLVAVESGIAGEILP